MRTSRGWSDHHHHHSPWHWRKKRSSRLPWELAVLVHERPPRPPAHPTTPTMLALRPTGAYASMPTARRCWAALLGDLRGAHRRQQSTSTRTPPPQSVGLLAIRDDLNSSFKRGPADGPPHMLRAFNCPSGNLMSETGVDLSGRTVDFGSVFRRAHHEEVGGGGGVGGGGSGSGSGRGDVEFYEKEIAPKLASMLVRGPPGAASCGRGSVGVICVAWGMRAYRAKVFR